MAAPLSLKAARQSKLVELQKLRRKQIDGIQLTPEEVLRRRELEIVESRGEFEPHISEDYLQKQAKNRIKSKSPESIDW